MRAAWTWIASHVRSLSNIINNIINKILKNIIHSIINNIIGKMLNNIINNLINNITNNIINNSINKIVNTIINNIINNRINIYIYIYTDVFELNIVSINRGFEPKCHGGSSQNGNAGVERKSLKRERRADTAFALSPRGGFKKTIARQGVLIKNAQRAGRSY
jgi:hypothetical protein